MRQIAKRIGLAAVVLGLAIGAAGQAAAGIVKEYQTNHWATGVDNENTVAQVGGGLTFAGQVWSAADLLDADIVIAGVANAALLNPWVQAGGILIVHDWWQYPATSLPGLSSATQASYNSQDVNVVDSSHAIVNGPFGTITDALLDGGNSSNHGAWAAASLVSTDPNAGPIRSILSSTSSSSVVVFEYTYGLGHIIYARIPLEAYTDTNPLVTGTQPAGLRVYARNELAYANSLIITPVPEPTTLAGGILAGLVSIGYCWRRRGTQSSSLIS